MTLTVYDQDEPATANGAFIVHDNDVVAIPCGYHPLAAAPEHRVWVLAGDGSELKFFTHESMRWLEPRL